MARRQKPARRVSSEVLKRATAALDKRIKAHEATRTGAAQAAGAMAAGMANPMAGLGAAAALPTAPAAPATVNLQGVELTPGQMRGQTYEDLVIQTIAGLTQGEPPPLATGYRSPNGSMAGTSSDARTPGKSR